MHGIFSKDIVSQGYMSYFTAEQIKTVAVCGAGTMGAGIAALFAREGYITVLYDLSDEALGNAEGVIRSLFAQWVARGVLTPDQQGVLLSYIGYTTDVESLEVDLVVEAIVEKAESKIELFRQLALINSTHTIFASNTSSIPITRLGAAVPHPERVVGMHFFNPAPVMKLVEVIMGAATHEEVGRTICALAVRLGKTPVLVKDSPGFIVNRVARHYYTESLKLLEEKVAPAETIDELLEATGFRMGPFKLMDLIGIDTNYYVTCSLFESFHQEPRFRPSRLQQQKIEAGHLGKKSKQGFYKY